MTDDNITRLADKIIACCHGDCDCIKHDTLYGRIESLLREAMEGEYKKGIVDSSYSEGRKDAMQEWQFKVTEEMRNIQKEKVREAYTRAAEVCAEICFCNNQCKNPVRDHDYECNACDCVIEIEKLKENQ